MARFTQRLDYPNPRTFVGKGKLEEIRKFIDDDGDIAMAIFDDDLSTKQVLSFLAVDGAQLLLEQGYLVENDASVGLDLSLAGTAHTLPTP